MYNFDDVFHFIGSRGRFQIFLFLLISFAGIPLGFQTFMNTFAFAVPPHRCRLSSIPDDAFDLDPSSARGALVARLVPASPDGERSSCQYFAHSGTFPRLGIDNASLVNCSSWVHDGTYFPDNVVTEFDLYCESLGRVKLANSMLFVGMLLGSLVFGDVSDRFGRRRAIGAGLIGVLIFGVATSFQRGFSEVILGRTLSVMCAFGVSLASFVLLLELFGPEDRATVGILTQLPTSISVIVFGFLANAVRPWRRLQLVASVPIVLILLLLFLIPESPRWLLTRGDSLRFKRTISRAAAFNGRDVPRGLVDDLLERSAEESDRKVKKESVSMLSIFRRPNLAANTFILSFCWFIVNAAYYGITMNLPSLSGDPYSKLTLNGLVEIPAIFLVLSLLRLAGRRPLLGGAFVVSGTACALCPFFPGDGGAGAVDFLAQVGKFGAAGAFAVIYIFSGELYPTPVRTIGLGVCSVSARIGGIFAAGVVGEAAKARRPEWSLGVFGVLSVVAGVVVFALPETRGATLPETLDEAEAFGRREICRKR